MGNTTVALSAQQPPAEVAAFGLPTWTSYDTGTNAALTATTALVANQQHYITKVTASFSAAVAAAVTLAIKDGTTVIWQVEIAPGVLTFTENFETRPLHGTRGTAVNVTVGAAGTGVVQTVCMAGFTAVAP